MPKALFRLGKIYAVSGQTDQAGTYFKETLALSLARKQWKWASTAASEMAFLSFMAGDHGQSLVWTERGTAWARKVGDVEAEVHNDFERVRTLNLIGKSNEALQLAKQMLARGGDIPALRTDLPIYNRLVGNILKQQGRFAEAESYFLISLALTKSLNNPERIASSELDLGFYYYERANYDRALYYYKQALQKAKDANRQGRLYDNIGAAYWMMKDFKAAIDNYQLGLVALRTDVKNAANQTANPSANSIRSSTYKEYLLTLIQDKADTWLDWAKSTQNNPARLRNALNTYALADTMIDFMRWEHTGQQSKLFWRGKTHRLYEQAIETAFRLNDAASAFRFMEKSRAVLLNDKLNELGASRQLAPAQLAREQQLRQRVADWQTKVAADSSGSRTYASNLDSLRILQEHQESFVKNLEQTNPAYYRYKYDNQTIPLSRVREQLIKRKASLLTYFIGDSTLYAIGITPTGTKLLRMATTAYTRPAAQLLALNANPDALNQQFTHYLTVSNQLYRTLLVPMNLPPGRVIVSPDGALLPFEALSTSATKPEFLVNTHAFSYAYSLNQLFKESTDAGTKPGWFNRSGSFLGIAPVDFSARLGQIQLAGSDAVLSRIGGQFSAPALLTGRQATRRAFGEQAGQYRIIQLFTHADADSTDREPTLFFADSTLRLSELTTTGQLPAELVGLSACKTGIGANQRGEGVFSLARGFASLGVPSILTTLWNVENQATYALTELFYSKLTEGLPKDIALQEAKIAYLADADQSDQLPNRWAGLLLVGNAEPIKKQLPSGQMGGWFRHRSGAVGCVVVPSSQAAATLKQHLQSRFRPQKKRLYFRWGLPKPEAQPLCSGLYWQYPYIRSQTLPTYGMKKRATDPFLPVLPNHYARSAPGQNRKVNGIPSGIAVQNHRTAPYPLPMSPP